MYVRIICISLILLSFIGTAAVNAGDDPVGEQIDAYLTDLQAFGFSGSVLVEHEGDVVLQEGYGLANEATGRPITPETVFNIGSVTKLFTAVAILHAESQGLLALDDSIALYLPDLPEDKAAITIEHLLTHTSGLPDFLRMRGGQASDLYDAVINSPLESEPGTQYQYSNAGYGLLAQILAQATGQPYRDYIRAHIFTPAGMVHSGFDIDDWQEDQIAYGYDGFTESGSPLTWFSVPEILLGSGGIMSTPGDLYQFAVALREGRILNETALEMLLTPRQETGPNSYEVYGAHLLVLPDGSRRITAFGSSMPGHNAGLTIGLDELLTIAVTSGRNIEGVPLARSVLPQVRDLVDGIDITPVPQTVKLAPEQLEKLTGTFAVSDQGQITLTQAQGGLFLRAEGQDALNALFTLPPEQQTRYARLNTTAQAIAVAMIDGDFELLVDASGGRFSPDELAAQLGSNLAQWAQRFGSLRSVEVIGTVPRDMEAVTTVQFNFETGTQQLELIWSPDDSIVTFGPGAVSSRMLQPQSDTALAAFDLRTFELLLIEVQWDGDTPTLVLPNGMQATHITPEATASSFPVADVQAFLDQQVASDQFSGAVIVTEGETVVFEYTAGFANQTENIPISTDTLFNTGSMVKMFTSVGIMQLVEQGKLSPDDTIGQYLSGFPAEIADQVTISQLLSHTSGLGDFRQSPQYQTAQDSINSVSELLPYIQSESLAFEPGTQYSYSNSGFVVLGAIIEQVSGESYHDYVRSHILAPAGMDHTVLDRADADPATVAHPYPLIGADGQPVQEAPPRLRPGQTPAPLPQGPRADYLAGHPGIAMPAGGAYTTLGDMLKFAAALQNHILLGADTQMQMLTVHSTPGDPAGSPPSGQMPGYGYGFVIQGGPTGYFGHNGGAPGVGAEFRIYPELGYTLVAFSNYGAPSLMPIMNRLEQTIAG